MMNGTLSEALHVRLLTWCHFGFYAHDKVSNDADELACVSRLAMARLTPRLGLLHG